MGWLKGEHCHKGVVGAIAVHAAYTSNRHVRFRFLLLQESGSGGSRSVFGSWFRRFRCLVPGRFLGCPESFRPALLQKLVGEFF